MPNICPIQFYKGAVLLAIITATDQMRIRMTKRSFMVINDLLSSQHNTLPNDLTYSQNTILRV